MVIGWNSFSYFIVLFSFPKWSLLFVPNLPKKKRRRISQSR